MASVQEPEVQLAQRLASNEKPVRTKAMKKLRKYINVRSHNAAGGFTGDELLKLWKGLFYCLWMQDKPLLQEELSNQICTLIHSFHDIDGQFLYLENFLQTFKREWAGIDRLRMDKFLQLVRFMFRQTFEILKKKDWDSSLVGRFLELLTVQLLQSSSEAPSGLQFHILDLYMTELAAVGSAELTADQNLIFIEPFCKTAAKTKDRSLFGAICNSILSTIIDQAPFAIEDLMKEVKAAEDSDSGQASEEDDKEDQPKESKSKAGGKKWRQINGNKSSEEEGQDDDDDDDDDNDDDDDDDDDDEEEEEEELLHLEDSDTEMSRDDDIGPVLQFDYAALADKLFELASRSSTPSHNRQRLYKIVKLLRDLNEGVFPQDEYPEEVSTDEDDDMFGSRKRMKRGGGHMEEEEDEGAPAAKKTKRKKKKASTLNKQSNDSGVHEEQATLPANNEKKKKRRKRKKKKNAGQDEDAGGEGHIERCEEELTVAQSQTAETEGSLECSQTEDLKQEVQPQSSSVRVTEAATPEGQSQTLLLSEGKKQPTVTVTEETSQSSPCTSDDRDQSEMFSKKTERETSEVKAEVTEAAEGQQSVATVPGKKKKKKKKCLKAEEVQDKAQLNGVNTEADFPLAPCEDSKGGGPTSGLEKQTDSETLSSKKRKKKNLKADEAAEVEAEHTNAEIPSVNQEASQDAAAVAPKKKTKKKGKQEDAAGEAVPAAEETTVTPQRKKGKKNQKEPKTTVEEEGKAAETSESADADKLLFEITMTTSAKKKKKKKKLAADKELQKDQTQPQLAGSVNEEGSSSGKPAKKKKRKIPVEFEYEVDELRAAAQQDEATTSITAEQPAAKKSKAGSNVGEPSTSLNIKMSQKKAKTSSELASKFITFQSKAPVPAPLFCKTKGSPKNQKAETPRAESKKVTFGLKNNKTAEFRKTDRSLLVSPDGSSRVPFDPKQRPKCGVLKSPTTPLSIKKTPKKVNKKSSSMTPKSALKRRL